MKLFYWFIRGWHKDHKNYIIYPFGNPSFLGYNIMYVVTFWLVKEEKLSQIHSVDFFILLYKSPVTNDFY